MSKNEWSERKISWIILIMAVLLHMSFAIVVFMRTGTSNWADSWEYWDIGRQFASGNWYPSRIVGCGEPFVVVAPLLPLLVAGGIAVFGHTFWPVIILNALMAAAMVLVFYLLGRELFNRKTGLWLAGISLLDITYYRYTPQLLKEPMVYLLVPLTALLLIKLVKSGYLSRYLLSSAFAFSVLIHADERYFFFFPFILIYLFLQRQRQWQFRLSRIALWLAIVILTMVPWTIRNYRQFGQVVLLSPRTTAFTSYLWGQGMTGEHFQEELKDPKASLHYRSAVQLGEKYGKQPRFYGRFEKYLVAFKQYWQPVFPGLEFQTHGFRPIKWSVPHNLTSMAFYGIFLPFYLAGLVLLLKRKLHLAYLLGALPLLHSVLHTITLYPLERYRYAVNFCIVLIALWVMQLCLEYIKEKTGRTRACGQELQLPESISQDELHAHKEES